MIVSFGVKTPIERNGRYLVSNTDSVSCSASSLKQSYKVPTLTPLKLLSAKDLPRWWVVEKLFEFLISVRIILSPCLVRDVSFVRRHFEFTCPVIVCSYQFGANPESPGQAWEILIRSPQMVIEQYNIHRRLSERLSTCRNNNVIIASKRRHDVVLT